MVVTQARTRWQAVLARLDAPADDHPALLGADAQTRRRPGDTLLDLMLRRDLRESYRREVGERLGEIFAGQDLTGVRERLAAIHRGVLDSRLFVALHMHAGDGNVHTNIPVHSADYAMLHAADLGWWDRIMALATDLGGVISGEHGIGITKLRYLEPEKLAAFVAYGAGGPARPL